MIAAQGGDPDWVAPTAAHQTTVRAEHEGTVVDVDALAVGHAAWRLGAGRSRKEDSVSALAGVLVHVRPGDRVARGDVLFELFADDEVHLRAGVDAVADATRVGDENVTPPSLLLDVVGD
jgi:thymidine phosphorylase